MLTPPINTQPSKNFRTIFYIIKSFSKPGNSQPTRTTLCNIPLTVTNPIKYLGMHIDKRLTFKNAIEHNVWKTAAAALNLIFLNRHLCTTNKLLLYKTILRPILTYPSSCWRKAAKTHLDKVQVAQNKCLWMTLGADPRTPARQIHQAQG